ncbi:MAG TPA: transposase [Gemmatimonadales bacterium]|nr:transposase [Gemmatimonadales bacterium]
MPSAPPLRLRNFDYSAPGAYLITITTAGRSPSLGRLTQGGVELSALGKLVAQELGRTEALRSGVIMDAVAIMPDHIHFIVLLTDQAPGGSNISRVVNGFKAAVTSGYRRRGGDQTAHIWQRGFHDRVIRSDRDLAEARRYVLENPAAAWLKQVSHAR